MLCSRSYNRSRIAIDRADFETQLRDQGYREVVDRRLKPGVLNPERAHEFDAYPLVLEGAMTITSEQGKRTSRAGDTYTMTAG